MNWSSVKNLLILMLLCANIFLVYSITSQDRNRSYIDEDELFDAAAILAERGFEVNLAGIPTKRFDAPIYGSDYVSDDDYYDRVVTGLSGSEREQAHMLLDGGVRITAQNGASVEFGKDFSFSYSSEEPEIGENSAVKARTDAYNGINADNFDEHSVLLSELGLTRFVSLSKAAVEFLSLGKSDEAHLSARALAGAYDDESGLAYILVAQEIDGFPIFRHRALCVFEGDVIVEASGRWYFEAIDHSYSFEAADQVNILFTDYDALKAQGRESDEQEALPAVESMSACYSIYMNADKTALYFIPAWQIDHDNGRIIVYNTAQSTQYFSS